MTTTQDEEQEKGVPDQPTRWIGPAKDLRLTGILRGFKNQEGGYAGLARAISRLSPELKKGAEIDVIDRRKLKLLVEGGKTEPVLSISELRALDRYLEGFGEGLAHRPLFLKPDLIHMLADSERVTFLLGSRADDRFASFSHWDVLAMAEIQRNVSAAGRSVQFEILEVPLDRVPQSPDLSGPLADALNERGTSVVSIGSSRATPATEAVKCRMFQREPFCSPPLEEKLELPFHFIWNPTLHQDYESSFLLKAPDIRERDAKAASRIAQGASALALEDDVLVDGVSEDSRHGNTYAACVVQRRSHEGIWLVLAGLTGPATYAAAKAANRMSIGIAEPERGSHSEVYWWVIRGKVSLSQARQLRTVREFKEEVIRPPAPWRPPGSRP